MPLTDGLGRLTKVVEDPSSGGLNYQTTYSYGANDTLQFVTQGAQAPRTFYYDSLARLVAAANLENTVWYGYDNVGNLTSRTDGRNITTTYGYDVLNRVTSKSYNGGSTYNVTYTYCTGNPANSMGHLTQVNNGWSITNYTAFDPVGNVKASNQQTASQTYSFAYLYNLAGALTSETYPSGRVVNTSYDAANRPDAVAGLLQGQPTTYVSNMNYAPQASPNSYAYGNNLWESYVYNNRLQTTATWGAINNDPSKFLYVLYPNWGGTNNNGNLQAFTEYVGGPAPWQSLPNFAQSFSYDHVNRLTGVNDTGGYLRSFGYDQWGNMWVTGNSGVPLAGNTPTSNVYNGNNQINGASYDGAGNQTAVNGNTLSYDAENRQIQATEPPSLGGATESYYYDGDGQRVQKSVSGGATTIYVYDALGQLAAEYSTAAAPVSPCSTCYLSDDHLGSVRMVTDQNANVVSRHDYLPFGEELPGGTAGRNGQWGAFDNTSQRFTGQVRDSETGEDFFNARYFTGALGRFNSADPGNAGADLANPQSWNGYAYVMGNPLAMVDPSGMAQQAGGGGASSGGSPAAAFDACLGSFLSNDGFLGSGWIWPPGNPLLESATQCEIAQQTVWNSTGGGGGGGGSSASAQSQQPPATNEAPAPNNGEPPSACLIANINAVNAVSNLNVNLSNVVGQPFIFNGGLDVNFAVPGASPSQLPAGRYAFSALTRILGIGHSLHVPGSGGADPSTYGVDPTTGNFTFTTHIDTAYSTWHTPIGALIHFFVDLRDRGAHRGPC